MSREPTNRLSGDPSGRDASACARRGAAIKHPRRRRRKRGPSPRVSIRGIVVKEATQSADRRTNRLVVVRCEYVQRRGRRDTRHKRQHHPEAKHTAIPIPFNGQPQISTLRVQPPPHPLTAVPKARGLRNPNVTSARSAGHAPSRSGLLSRPQRSGTPYYRWSIGLGFG
jgi:hypothetical protein